jgi:hypothetical protein
MARTRPRREPLTDEDRRRIRDPLASLRELPPAWYERWLAGLSPEARRLGREGIAPDDVIWFEARGVEPDAKAWNRRFARTLRARRDGGAVPVPRPLPGAPSSDPGARLPHAVDRHAGRAGRRGPIGRPRRDRRRHAAAVDPARVPSAAGRAGCGPDSRPRAPRPPSCVRGSARPSP